MTVLALLTLLASAASEGSTLSGEVLTLEGNPVAGARVFIEQGLDGAIRESRSRDDGTYTFDNVESGTVGVFAIADEFAFGGLSITVPSAEHVQGLTIRLRPPVSLSGRVKNEDGDAVEGARIIRIGLMNEPQAKNPSATTKLGIPYAKLEPMGFKPIATGKDGRFTIPALPRDSLVALKVACHGYAQQGISDLHAGDSKAEVVLQRGILIQGHVLTRAAKEPLSGAVITLRNAQPPHDTAITRSDGSGEFAVRLQPGVYLYKAAGGDFRSIGWEELLVTGQQSAQSVVMYVVASCEIHGKVANAVTGDPIAGARVVLRAFGNPDSSARTNAHGEFTFRGVEGENTVILESAPGYVLPERNARPVNATESQRVELPTFWVLPTPEVQLSIVDQDLEPVPRCVVSLVQPPQFGWQEADSAGRVPLRMEQLASEGVVMGLAEHIERDLGALFAFDTDDNKEPVVQLLPLGTVVGSVRDASKTAVPGAMLTLVLSEDQMETPIWRTISAPDGRFEFPGVVPHIQLQCIVLSPKGSAKSEPFVVEPSARKDVGTLTAPSAQGTSFLGQTLQWTDYPPLGGPELRDTGQRAVVLAFCPSAQAAMLIEGWERVSAILDEPGITVAVLTDAPLAAGIETGIPVLQGKAPATATTYVVSGQGKVLFETFGIPPLAALHQRPGGTR